MKAISMAAVFLTGCSTTAMHPWPQAQRLDEPSCLAACARHDEECPKIFAAFPERGAVECPASHDDCVRSCKAAAAAPAPAVIATPTPAASAPIPPVEPAPVLVTPTPAMAAPAPPLGTSKEAKLRELKRLYEQGLVTDEVYRARQLAILSEP
jgi:hypothetical protein